MYLLANIDLIKRSFSIQESFIFTLELVDTGIGSNYNPKLGYKFHMKIVNFNSEVYKNILFA